MKHLILSLMILPLNIFAQNTDTVTIAPQTADEFINTFYLSHADVDKMQSFFDPLYFKSIFKFREHIVLKNAQYGNFVDKQLIGVDEQTDGSVIWRKFKIKYSKGSLVEEINLRRSCAKCLYKITRWEIKR